MAIRSMTGYGQGSVEIGEARLAVEIRSVNHRFADVRLRMPSELSHREPQLRRKVLGRLRRGRVEVQVRIDRLEGGDGRGTLNRPFLEELVRTVPILREELGIQGKLDLGAVLAVPGLFRAEPPDLAWNDDELRLLDEAVDRGLGSWDEDRQREGRTLQRDLQARFSRLVELAGSCRGLAPRVPERLRDKLVQRLEALGGELRLDPARVAQEAAILADRCDVTEELVRLAGHLEQGARLVGAPGDETVGKRLDFLMQEIHREINTISSKSNDLELTRLTLELKHEAEKIREQVQNLE